MSEQSENKLDGKKPEVAEATMSTAIEFRPPPPLKLDDISSAYGRWKRFLLSMKIYMSAAGFERYSEARKGAILLNTIGDEAQELYINVLSKNNEPAKYEDIVNCFEEYFQPTENEVLNAFLFNMRSQGSDERFDAFYTDIKKISKTCNFETLENRLIRDRIVMGIYNKKTQQKLLEIKELTLQQAVDICRSAELSSEHVKQISNQEATLDVIQSKYYRKLACILRLVTESHLRHHK